MTADARAALDQFIASIERHFAAASQRRSELDPAVVEAYDALAGAFERYDEALFTSYDEVTPFVLSEDDEGFDDDDDDAEDDDEDVDVDDEDDVMVDGTDETADAAERGLVVDLDRSEVSGTRTRETF